MQGVAITAAMLRQQNSVSSEVRAIIFLLHNLEAAEPQAPSPYFKVMRSLATTEVAVLGCSSLACTSQLQKNFTVHANEVQPSYLKLWDSPQYITAYF